MVHYCDHATYVKYFAEKYACMSMRYPFEPFSETAFWTEMQDERGVDVHEVMENPASLIKQYDLMRTR